MEFRDDLMFPGLEVTDRDELLGVLGGAVIAAGLAKETYSAALRDREVSFPTGLPVSGGVAIPHTSAEWVMANTIACATLAHPISFHEMGGEADSEIAVSTVFLLVVADSTQQVKLLSSLIRKLRDGRFVAELRTADTPAAMCRILATTLT